MRNLIILLAIFGFAANSYSLETLWTQIPAAGIIKSKLSEDKKSIITLCNDSTVKFWNVEDGSLIKEKKFHIDGYSAIDVASNGEFIVYIKTNVNAEHGDTTIYVFFHSLDLDTSIIDTTAFIHGQCYCIHEKDVIITPNNDKLCILYYYNACGDDLATGQIFNIDANTFNLNRIKTISSNPSRNNRFSNDGKIFFGIVHETHVDYKKRPTYINDMCIYDENFNEIKHNNWNVGGYTVSNKLDYYITYNNFLYYNDINIYNFNTDKLINIYNLSFIQYSMEFTNDDRFVIMSNYSDNNSNHEIIIKHFSTFLTVDSIMLPNSVGYKFILLPDNLGFITLGNDNSIKRWKSKLFSKDLNPAFVTNKTIGNSPQNIRFYDMTSGNPVSWKWDFGDGITSTEQNPVHEYFKPGIYTIKLIVSNSNKKDSIIKSDYISINSYIKNNDFSLDTFAIINASDSAISYLDFNHNGEQLFAAGDSSLNVYSNNGNFIYHKNVSNFKYLTMNQDNTEILHCDYELFCLSPLQSSSCTYSFKINIKHEKYNSGDRIYYGTPKFKYFSNKKEIFGIYNEYYNINDPQYEKLVPYYFKYNGSNTYCNHINYNFYEPTLFFDISNDNESIAVLSRNELTIVDTTYYFRVKYSVPYNFFDASELFFIKDTKDILVSTKNGYLYKINYFINKIDTLYKYTNGINAMAISIDGTKIITGHYDGSIYVYDLLQRKIVDFAQVPSAITKIAMSPNESQFATGTQDGHIYIWNSNHISNVENNSITVNNETILFPNPATETLNIEIQSNSALELIQIYNTLGECVITKQINSNHNIKIDVSSLNSGVYYVKIGTEIKKIVIYN